nr:MAG TPA_asm: HopJ type III effector protein [Caudoviricetes sp.]
MVRYDNSSHVPCVQGVLGVVNGGSCKILS